MSDRGRIAGMITVGLVLTVATSALAQTPIEWTGSEPLTGVVEGGELFVEVASAGVYPLLMIDEPGVQPPRFEVDGSIRYEDVAGIAYLEMWTVLPDGTRYFTRTLAESGPLGHMTGSSEPRPFSLPFELGEGGPVPARLEINLVAAGPGRFWIGPLAMITAGDQVETTTSSTRAATTTVTSLAPATTATTTDDAQAGNTALWWGLAAVAVVGAIGALGWSRSVRRRRAEEQRKMNAIDSLRS